MYEVRNKFHLTLIFRQLFTSYLVMIKNNLKRISINIYSDWVLLKSNLLKIKCDI